MFGEYTAAADRLPESILKLRGEKKMYLYGNGIYAKEALAILQKFHIGINGVIASDEFVVGEEAFCGYKLYAASNFFHENNRGGITIVAGFHAWRNKELTDRLIANRQVQKIYVLNGCDILWANDFIFPDPKIYLIDNYYEALIKRNLNWQYFKDNYTLFFQTYHWLEDEKSRKTMDCYLKGHIELKEFPMLEVWETADVEKQYFPEDLIRMSEEEVFVDCGAYTGDTLEAFLKRTNGFIKYYALEPDGRYFDEPEFPAFS